MNVSAAAGVVRKVLSGEIALALALAFALARAKSSMTEHGRSKGHVAQQLAHKDCLF